MKRFTDEMMYSVIDVLLQVIEVWYKKAAPMTVRDCIENIASWVKVGFVSPDVWLDLQEEVRLDVLCGYMETTFVEQKPEKCRR